MVHLGALYERYRGRVEFAFVGIDEAGHEIDGFEFLLEGRRRPLPFGERLRRTCRAAALADFAIPAYLEAPGADAAAAYAPWPGRLVVIDSGGRVARDFGNIVAGRWDAGEVASVLDAEAGTRADEADGADACE